MKVESLICVSCLSCSMSSRLDIVAQYKDVNESELFQILNWKIEWTKEQQKDHYDAIKSGWEQCSPDIIYLLFMMIAPVLTKHDMEERRMDWWMAKMEEEEESECDQDGTTTALFSGIDDSVAVKRKRRSV